MNCDEYQESINLFLDGGLEAAEQVSLFGHIAACAVCQDYLAVMVRVKKRQAEEEIPFPGDLDERIISALSISNVHSVPKSREPFWRRPVRLPLAMAASAAVVILLLGFLLDYMFMSKQGKNTFYPLNEQKPTTVIMIYGMPPVEVLGKRIAETSNELRQN